MSLFVKRMSKTEVEEENPQPVAFQLWKVTLDPINTSLTVGQFSSPFTWEDPPYYVFARDAGHAADVLIRKFEQEDYEGKAARIRSVERVDGYLVVPEDLTDDSIHGVRARPAE